MKIDNFIYFFTEKFFVTSRHKMALQYINFYTVKPMKIGMRIRLKYIHYGSMCQNKLTVFTNSLTVYLTVHFF